MIMGAEEAQLGRLRTAVDARLAALLPPPAASPLLLTAAMRHAVLAPGKRLRPLLTLLAARCLDGPERTALDPACAVELVHAASLVLDDLPCMDDAPLRRGLPSTHARFGEDVAVLAAVALLNQAYAIVARAPGVGEVARLKMITALSEAIGVGGLVGGQEEDLRGDGHETLATLREVHHRKTGVLFMAAVEIGARAAGAEERVVEVLKRFAAELGLAFQALDDLDDGVEDRAGAADTATSVLALLGRDGARREADRRLDAAKAVLSDGGARLEPIGRYVDLILGQ